MKIGFDLDNTLIRSGFDFPTEEPEKKLLFRLIGGEKLRTGTREIFNFCKEYGFQTWIYTTSYRSHFYIYCLFWLYGIKLQGVINQKRHNEEVKIRCSKHPPHFGINLLVDDSEGVKIEGEKHNFKVIWIRPDDENWTDSIKKQVLSVQ